MRASAAKTILAVMLCVLMLFPSVRAEGEAEAAGPALPEASGETLPEASGDAVPEVAETGGWNGLFTDLVAALAALDLYGPESAEYAQAQVRVNDVLAELDDPLADSVANEWRQVYLNSDYRVFIYGEDDPSLLPVTGRHAFVVLGFELENGEMKDELKARCDAAAVAAKAFSDSVLLCSGGATGENNPENHTEAGLMKAYLVGEHGIDAERIFIDEEALTTTENALNTLEILKTLGITRITLVTSSYHQRRANMLYFTLAELARLYGGYSLELAGNFSNRAEADWLLAVIDPQLAVYQLGELIDALRPSDTPEE
ncbi:MAG: YdcF family protein [Clostridiales bacterium]|nr:YdcF family protein [Clostridiales bacterium]